MTHHHIIPSPTAIVGDFASAFTRLAPGTIADAGAAAIAFGLCLVYVITDYTWNRPDKHGYIWYQRPQEQDAAGRAASQTTRNIAQRLDELVCYSIPIRLSVIHVRIKIKANFNVRSSRARVL